MSDEEIFVNAAFPENFRCIVSEPSECGKTFLLKELIISNINFDEIFIIGPTGDQYEGTANIEFIKDVKNLPSSDQLPENLKDFMIFNDVNAKEPVSNEYFC